MQAIQTLLRRLTTINVALTFDVSVTVELMLDHLKCRAERRHPQRRRRRLRRRRQLHLLLFLLPLPHHADRDSDSNSYTYFDTETFTDAETGANA